MKADALRYSLLSLLIFLLSGCGYTVMKESPPPPAPPVAHYKPRNVESKLEPFLVKVMHLAESPDTSGTTRAEFEKLLLICSDDSGRIPVVVNLYKQSGYRPVMSQLRSLKAEVDYSGRDIPYIFCRVHPLDLRPLIKSSAVRCVYRPAKSHGQVS